MLSLPDCVLLERDPRAELATARSNRDAVAQGRVIDLPEISPAEALAGNVEAGMVEDINPVRAQFKVNPLSQVKVLSQ